MHHNRRAFDCGHALFIRVQTVVVIVILILVVPVRGQVHTSDLAKKENLRQWHKYTNNKYGFSFWYPDPYRPVPLPPPNTGDEFRHSANKERRLLLLERRDDPEAKIWISIELRQFNLHSLWQSHAPTGYDEDKTPAPLQIGMHTFYLYGPGGGGVDYPDQYFVNLRGKILEFDFDGPYEGKSPSGETPELEPKILKTFRVL